MNSASHGTGAAPYADEDMNAMLETLIQTTASARRPAIDVAV